MKQRWLSAFGAGVAALLAAGCQTYDFEPVEPLAIAQTTQSKTVIAKQLKPNLMLLVDTSGSMNFPTNTSDPICPLNCGQTTPCPAGCPTRLSELKLAMSSFLGSFQQSPVARVGMLAYPSPGGDGCNPATAAEITTAGRGVPIPASEDDAALKQVAGQVNSVIQSISATGGTPTAASLAALGTYDALQAKDREQFILLLTDGLPNCNASTTPNSCGGATGCNTLCTNSAWQPGQGCCTLTGACSGNYCAKGCLDKDLTVKAVEALATGGVRTIVVGFGADLVSGPGPDTLNALAKAGGFGRKCPNGTDAECGGGTNKCDVTKFCTMSYYQARNSDELKKALEQIGMLVGVGDPCVYSLDAVPSDPKFLAVIIDGVSVRSGPDTWKYEGGKVTFLGGLCSKLSSATPTNPVKVEFRIVEGL
ncbi:MAG: adventurous gliding motility lipoprotein CglB [Myxococcales bacterium]|nr:adventurous gliding motility lipoprotein CglB [Myxococcales bacterium]